MANNQIDREVTDMPIMPNWLSTTIGSVGVILFTSTVATIKLMWKKQKAYETGLTGLLYVSIRAYYKECENKGYATVEDKEDMCAVYNSYHTLGGNGTGTALYKRVMAMPTELSH